MTTKETRIKGQIMAGGALLVIGILLSLFVHDMNPSTGGSLAGICALFGAIILALGAHRLGRLGRDERDH